MADNLKVKDASSIDQLVRTTDSGGIHTPHHHVDSLPGTVQANLATLAGAVSGSELQADIVSTPSTGASGASAPTSFQMIAGVNGGNVDAFTTDGSGRILAKLAANSGVDIGDVDVKTVGVPSTVRHGVKAVATAGTPVALSSSQSLSGGVTIKAKMTNGGFIYVGFTGMTAGASQGFELGSGDQIFVEVDNLASVLIDSSVSGEGVTFIGS